MGKALLRGYAAQHANVPRVWDVLEEENQYHYTMKSGKAEKPKVYHSSVCRPYKKLHANVRSMLMKLHPPPPSGTPCAACNRIDKLFLDHCHAKARIDPKKTVQRLHLPTQQLGLGDARRLRTGGGARIEVSKKSE